MDECIACGLCVELCPAVFAQGEDKPIIAKQDVGPAEEACAQEAIDSCPVSCIYWL
ncbi:MAG: ferredoxin [Desulfarculus sp.]|nr:ferredoxin [Desulfarculus sp.]